MDKTYYNCGLKPCKFLKNRPIESTCLYCCFLSKGSWNCLKILWTIQTKNESLTQKKIFTRKQNLYIKVKLSEGWIPEVIIVWAEKGIGCFMQIIYSCFKESFQLDLITLPWKPNVNQTVIKKLVENKVI